MDNITILNNWIYNTFGPRHFGDHYNIDEIVQFDKQKNELVKIKIEFTKKQGWQKAWTEDETRNEWEAVLLQLIQGKLLTLKLITAESNENNIVGKIITSKDGTRKLDGARGRIFDYRFKLEIVVRKKRLRRDKNENT